MRRWITENCYVDMDEKAVYLNDKKTPLKGKAWAVLEYFLECPNRKLERDQIRDRCWNVEERFGDKSLDNQIRAIRDAIGDKKPYQYLKNQSQIGYELSISQELIKREKDIDKKNKEEKLQELQEFGISLRENTKNIIECWERSQEYKIDSDLLVSCAIKEDRYDTLYECVNNIFEKRLDHHYVVQAMGGAGKTASLVYACRRILEEREDIIPVFLQMRNVDYTLKNPIEAYLYEMLVDKIEYGPREILERRFMDHLRVYLTKSGKNLLIVLDGCNECEQNGLADIENIKSLPNTIIMASSRIKDFVSEKFVNVQLSSLNRQSKIDFLKKYEINIEKRQNVEFLNTPFYLYRYAQIYKNKGEVTEETQGSQATIIREWIAEDKYKHILKNEKKKNDIVFGVDILLPLMSVVIFFSANHAEHRSLYVTQHMCSKVLNEIAPWFEDKEVSNQMLMNYGIDVSQYNEKECIHVLRDILVDEFAFLEKGHRESFSFSWAHECYRDWFIAKGLIDLKGCFETKFNEYMSQMVNQIFVYPDVFKEHKDYPAYYVGVYFAELLGREKLIEQADDRYRKLMSNIALFADDIGESDRVIEYASCVVDWEKKHETDAVSLYEKAGAYSGMAYSLLHIGNMDDSQVLRQIAENAHSLLEKGRSCIDKLFPFEFGFEALTDEELLTLHPDDVNNYYERNMKAISQVVEGERDSIDREENLIGKVLVVYSKLLGNYGMYYQRKSKLEKEPHYLIEAYRSHLQGGCIKYYNYVKNPEENGEGLVVSYTSLGVDLYQIKKYQLSVDFIEYGTKQYEMSQDQAMISKSLVLRSKIGLLAEEVYSEDLLEEVAGGEKSVVEYFINNNMDSEFERAVVAIADLMSISELQATNAGANGALIDLAEYIENIYAEKNMNNKAMQEIIESKKRMKRKWKEYHW